ncbi:MAG: class I SAM-dependent methyltransferase [Pseudonocardia sp.]|nr:class I SAM-dependent methyltransferase [Pseudonocardia sp.]
MHSENAVVPRAHHWNRVYAERGERGVSWFAEQPRVSLELLDDAGVGPQCSVLDVGAGASRLEDALIDRGHRSVSALDVSEQGLAVTRGRLGPRAARAKWIVTDLLDWVPDQRYQVWHDRAVFHFLTDPADRARYLDVLDTALTDDGIVVIATFADDGPQACSGLPTARYSPDQLLDELGGADRWTRLGQRREPHTTPSGVVQAFTWLALRRRAA